MKTITLGKKINEAKSPDEIKAERDAKLQKLTDLLPKLGDKKTKATENGDKLAVQIIDLDMKITQMRIQKIKLQQQRAIEMAK